MSDQQFVMLRLVADELLSKAGYDAWQVSGREAYGTVVFYGDYAALIGWSPDAVTEWYAAARVSERERGEFYRRWEHWWQEQRLG